MAAAPSSLVSSGASLATLGKQVVQVWAYHRGSKHSTNKLAPSLKYLDWENQPDPFRYYHGSPRYPLPHPPPSNATMAGNAAAKSSEWGQGPLERIYNPRLRGAPAPLTAASVSQLFYFSMALSAWKKGFSNKWSLRCNPSSGNLHPTEAYAVLPRNVAGLTGASPGIFHYLPLEHALELRGEVPASSAGGGEWVFGCLPPGGLLVGLASIYWRESWKYGVRAFRYCHLDVGHAIAALSFSAAMLGWRVELLPQVTDRALALLLGVERSITAEPEQPDVLLAIYPADAIDADPETASDKIGGAIAEFLTEDVTKGIKFREDQPNVLSGEQLNWKEIHVVHVAAKKIQSAIAPREPLSSPTKFDSAWPDIRTELQSGAIIRQRRSAVDMDGSTAMKKKDFYRTLGLCVAYRDRQPFDVFPWAPFVHLFVFVHRVQGLAPGTYVLVRNPDSVAPLIERSEGGWTKVEEEAAPDNFFRIAEGNFQAVARGVSCRQDIASDGAFAVAMVCDFGRGLERFGAWFYKALHWEAGVLGQVLYLEAEAAGLRGTGIGCFFDDQTLQVFGLPHKSTCMQTEMQFQDVYHFTIGGPVEDSRLQTVHAYHHLQTTGSKDAEGNDDDSRREERPSGS